MRVLITSQHGKANLVKAFEDAGATVVKTLLELPDLIVPTVDEELPFFSENIEWFNAQGIEVMVSGPYTMQMCRDKQEFARFCRRHGFKTPESIHGNLIAKPRFGKASRGVVRLDKSYIIQQFIDLPEVSIDYFADLSGNVKSIIPRFRKNVVNGESTEMEIVPNFNDAETRRLGVELLLAGHAVIQGFWTGSEVIFSEVNPRFGGGSHLTFPLFNSPKALMETLRVC